MTTKRKTFSKEFKQEAVRLLEQVQSPPAQIARELGINRNQLYKWQEQIDVKGVDAFPGKGRRSGKEDELAKLKREVDRLREENEILKKAARPPSGSRIRGVVHPAPYSFTGNRNKCIR